MHDVAVVVIAKSPEPGRAKTRLCPPCTPDEAALLAEAALRDTLRTVAACHARRRVLALDGEPGEWLPRGFDIVEQVGHGLAERLGNALVAAGGPALVVGMDTPQLTPRLLDRAAGGLSAVDAILGPALDGGYWTIGMRSPDPAAFEGVPMSTARTCLTQRRRLDALGLRTRALRALRDVDTFADAALVAGACPAGDFAAAYRAVSASHAADHEQPMTETAAGARLEHPYV